MNRDSHRCESPPGLAACHVGGEEPHSPPAAPAGGVSATTVSTDCSSTPRPAWTFLTNHGHVLLCVAQHPGMRVRDVAEFVGVTERCVQRILTELEEAGYVTRVHRGRRNYYQVHPELPLRHPAEQHRQIADLLNVMLEKGESS